MYWVPPTLTWRALTWTETSERIFLQWRHIQAHTADQAETAVRNLHKCHVLTVQPLGHA